MPQVLYPVIPENITVHLGPPDSGARNITVPFTEYIKNVASNEIYPTWPENALRANIYAITTFALNRIYTEWYRSKGYEFDITSSTQFDQAYSENGEVFENISRIVDEIFNDYVVKQGTVQPFFTQFCNGTTSTCAGLSQWGTVELANSGLTPYEILQSYYGNDINIINDAPVQNIEESYPGTPLTVGDAGNNVKIIQTQLNRIARNYPAIPVISDPEGVYGVGTENAVRKFQEIFNLNRTGTVDKSTWYRIKQYYVGVKGLSELASEGINLGEAGIPFTTVLQEGQQGIDVRTLQYYLNVIAYFNPALSLVPLDGDFGPLTTQAVKDFQEYYGLEVTGNVGLATWETIDRIYTETVDSLGNDYTGGAAKIYPGYFLSEGMEGEAVSDLQGYLSFIADINTAIPKIPVTGYFGSATENAVETFQRLFGLVPNGAVGPLTWYTIAREYDILKGLNV